MTPEERLKFFRTECLLNWDRELDFTYVNDAKADIILSMYDWMQTQSGVPSWLREDMKKLLEPLPNHGHILELALGDEEDDGGQRWCNGWCEDDLIK